MSTIPETEVRADSLQVAYTVAPAAIGCAAGLMAGSLLESRASRIAALTVLTIGAGFALPSLVHFLKERVTGPETVRGSRRTLDGIRRAVGTDEWSADEAVVD